MQRPDYVPSDALYCPVCRQWFTGLQFIAAISGGKPTCPVCCGPVTS